MDGGFTLSDVPLRAALPLFVGPKFAPQRGVGMIPAAINADLTAAVAASAFPAGTSFAIFCYRHRGTLEVRIVVRGLSNAFLFCPDGSLSPEATDLHTQVTTIASAYNSVTVLDEREDA